MSKTTETADVSANRFTQIFRDEHRMVRDLLLDLVEAFVAQDAPRARTLLESVAVTAGPHFRYEEESLYPGLISIFGKSYVDKLLNDHDRIIGDAQRLVAIAAKNQLSEAEVAEAVRLVRGILPHVSDCDGLSIMVERLPDEKVRGVFDARDRARREGLNLMTWAKEVRTRPVVHA